MVLKWVDSIDERHVFKLPKQEYSIRDLTDVFFIATSFIIAISCNLEFLHEYSDMLNTNECNIFKSLRMCKTLS